MPPKSNTLNLTDAARLLGVEISASLEDLRKAYLQKVQQHSPDRDPELFEQIRDAYEQLRDPSIRAQAVLHGPDLAAPLTSLLQGLSESRAFVGPELWLQALKERRA